MPSALIGHTHKILGVFHLGISCTGDSGRLEVPWCIFLLVLNNCFVVFRAFVPLEAPPGQNSTQWEKVQYLFEELGSSRKCIFFKKCSGLFSTGDFISGAVVTVNTKLYLFYVSIKSDFIRSTLFLQRTHSSLTRVHPWLHLIYFSASFCYLLFKTLILSSLSDKCKVCKFVKKN